MDSPKELNYAKLRQDLVNLLESYLKNPSDPVIQRRLVKLWDHYANAFPFIKKEYLDALGIGLYLASNFKPPKKAVKHLLEKLKTATI